MIVIEKTTDYTSKEKDRKVNEFLRTIDYNELMTRIEKLNAIQEEAIQQWIASDCIGTVNIFTGGGKNFVAYKAMYKVKPTGKIWMLAETDLREKTFIDEAKKFEQIYGKNPFSDFDIEFYCYQGLPTGNPEMIVYDEAHECATATRIPLLQIPAKYKIGLSAFIQENATVFRDRVDSMQLNQVYQSNAATEQGKITDYITKGQLLEIYLPIIYRYDAEKARENGLLNQFKTIVIEHQLDNTHKNIQITKNWKGTEQDYWNFWYNFSNDRSKNAGFRAVIKKQRLPKFLYNLPSKAVVAKKLLSKLGDKKTIVFGVEGVSNGLLAKITPNVAAGKDAEQLVKDFNNGVITNIASSKKLMQGVTLDGLERIIMISYYATPSNLIQRLGRYRFDEGKEPIVYIIRTTGTMEDDKRNTKSVRPGWFSRMQEIKNSKGKLVDTIDLNIVKYINSKSLL